MIKLPLSGKSNVKNKLVGVISRLPATCNECGRVIKEAVEKNLWEDVGVLAETKQTFYCLKDAEEATKALLWEKSKCHSAEANVEETKKYKSGRPANGERKVDRILFSVVGKVEEKRQAAEN